MKNHDGFDEYQKTEYGYVAEAHFKTIESISTFFRHYLIIAAIPLSVGAALVSNASAEIPGKLLVAIFALVGILGLLMMCYVVNLRLDALLYARQVNLIRKYFYDKSPLPILGRQRFRLLPVDAHSPKYFEWYFLPVVVAFAIVNAAYIYLASGLWDFPVGGKNSAQAVWDHISASSTAAYCGTGALLIHIILYLILAHYREHRYLSKAPTVLVDIDGVLNDHCEQFSKVFQKLHSRELNPNDIDALPVHRSRGLSVAKNEEQEVFRQDEYWRDMPPMLGAAEHLGDLRRQGLRIQIVTNRPWPEYGLDRQTKRNVLRVWRSQTARWLYSPGRRSTVSILRLWLRTMRPVEIITRAWLKEHGMQFDGIIVERRRPPRWERWFPSNTRFRYAQKRRPIFCVEDDPVNAAKLAFCSEVVFLLDMPYNRTTGDHGVENLENGIAGSLPANVVRVPDWATLNQLVRRFM